MHKDPLPGIFDLGARSIRYTIGLGAVTGFILSIFAQVGLLIWRAEPGGSARDKQDAGALENSMTARRRSPPPAPAATASVRY